MINKVALSNWQLKLISVLCAVILWIIASVQLGNEGLFPDPIELKVYNLTDKSVAKTDVISVKVKIIASSTVWQILNAEHFNAYVDVNNLSPGKYDLPISVSISKYGVQIVDIKPPRTLVVIN